MKTAIYPGTFDPITYGHIDVINKSLNVFDRVIVATTDNINKHYHFSIDERLDIINNSLFKDLRLNKKIETVFLMSDPENQVISSKFVKEIAKLNGKIDNFVTKNTKKSLKEKYD